MLTPIPERWVAQKEREKKEKKHAKNDVTVAISREEFKDCSFDALKRESFRSFALEALEATLAPIFHNISRQREKEKAAFSFFLADANWTSKSNDEAK